VSTELIPLAQGVPPPPTKADEIVAVRLSCQLDNGNPGAAPALRVPLERVIPSFFSEDTNARLPDGPALVLAPSRHISPRRLRHDLPLSVTR
jgi:hypothetical protein